VIVDVSRMHVAERPIIHHSAAIRAEMVFNFASFPLFQATNSQLVVQIKRHKSASGIGVPLFILTLGVLATPFQQLNGERFLANTQRVSSGAIAPFHLLLFHCGTSENYYQSHRDFYANCEHTQSGQMSVRITVITSGGRDFCMMCLRSQIAILLCGEIHVCMRHAHFISHFCTLRCVISAQVRWTIKSARTESDKIGQRFKLIRDTDSFPATASNILCNGLIRRKKL
jgi:hypothetical protein